MPGVVMGVDVARFGDVASVIRFRRGRDARSILPIEHRGANTMDRGSPGAIRKETLVMASSSAAHRHCYQRTELEQRALRPEPAASRRLSCPSTRQRP